MANKKKPLKKQKIRDSEYYDMQLVFDELYAASVKGQWFGNLVELIKRPENIKLAYRNAKQFYEEAYHFIEEKFGADYVICTA